MHSLIEESLIREFKDGIALFDPVTWQTHVLSNDGFSLLLDMVEVSWACNRIPERVVEQFLPPEGELRHAEELLQWAAIACHLTNESHRSEST